MNYYKILELDEGATIIEIKKAYKKLAMKYHPDKNGQENANEKFNEINEAYNTLKDEKHHSYKTIFNKLYKNDIFKKSINLFFNNFIYNYKYYNDTIIDLECSLEELYNGCTKNINYKRKYLVSLANIVEINENIDIHIKPGFKNNQKILYDKMGEYCELDNPRDLIINIKEKEHEIFEREDNNLIINIDLTLIEALTKHTKIEIPLLDEKILTYNINKIIKPNKFINIKNMGMPIFNTEQKGDLILKFNINFPNNITNKQIEILENINWR